MAIEATAITLAQPTDAGEIADVYLASRADALAFLPRLYTEEQVRRWIADVVLRRCKVYLARRGTRAVGFVALDGDEVDHLYVSPGFYRQGVGSQLLAVAKRESPGRLRLFTFQQNAPARAFYEKHGFQVVDLNDGSRNEEKSPDMQYEWTGFP